MGMGGWNGAAAAAEMSSQNHAGGAPHGDYIGLSLKSEAVAP